MGVGAERRWGSGAVTAAKAVLKLMLFGITPVVAFFNITRLEFDANLGAGIAIGWVALCVVGAIAYGASRGLRLDRPTTGTLMATTMQGNTGYLGLPLCAALLGTDRLGEAVVYDQLVQTSFLLTVIFAIAAAFGTKAGEGLRERAIAFLTRNPPLVGVVLGLLAPRAFAPDALLELSHLLVYSLVPLGFFAVGVTLASEAAPGRAFVPAFDRTVACALGLRLVAAPLLLLAIAAPLVDLPTSWLLLAAMPSGVNGLVVAHTYGLDVRLAAAAIAYSTVVVTTVAIVASVL